MDDLVTAVRGILELGSPAVYIIMIAVLWRQYVDAVRDHIEDLRRVITLLHACHIERHLTRRL